ncbi:MAG: VOC family protein [Acidimicrobiia bacterium]|nr:VOC family protein [Acidimicrobiia bacterium]
MEVLASRVLLHPSDFDRSFDFYARVVGLHLFREFGDDAARGAVFFTGGGYLELSGRSDDRPPGDRVGLWWQVRDVDREYERLAASGVEVIEPPTDKPWGLREARIVDPDGLLLVIVEVPDDHPLRRDTR